MLIEWKTLPVEIKADLTKREVTGYASTFGNVDHVNDRVLTGAYTKTLREDMPAGRIKVKRNHKALIGRPVHAEQDSKGLLTVSRLSETDLGNDTLILIADGAIDRMSIGYRAEDKGYANEGGRKIRELKCLALTEWSFLDEAPANDEAIITGVKSLYDVSCVLDQMQGAVYALQRLANLPAEVADRVAMLIKDLQKLPPVAADPAEVAEQQAQVNSLATLLSTFNTSLANSARSSR